MADIRSPPSASSASSASASSASADDNENVISKSTSDGAAAMDDDNDEDMATMSANLRSSLKVVRDPTKTAFDVLPTGETLGSFANRHAIDRYARKVESKRERARETRMKKRKLVKSIQRRKEKTPIYGHIGGACLSREIADGA